LTGRQTDARTESRPPSPSFKSQKADKIQRKVAKVQGRKQKTWPSSIPELAPLSLGVFALKSWPVPTKVIKSEIIA
jgi:hypothetical protein